MNNKVDNLQFLANVFSERINHFSSLIYQNKKMGLDYKYEKGRYDCACFVLDLITDLIDYEMEQKND